MPLYGRAQTTPRSEPAREELRLIFLQYRPCRPQVVTTTVLSWRGSAVREFPNAGGKKHRRGFPRSMRFGFRVSSAAICVSRVGGHPYWPVLDGRGPTHRTAGRGFQPLSDRSRRFRTGCVWLIRSAAATSQAGLAQGLAVSFLRSRHSPPEGKPPSQSMSGSAAPLAAFQVSADCRVWLSAEDY